MTLKLAWHPAWTRPACAAVLGLLPALSPHLAAEATEAPIAWTADQARAAGVRTQVMAPQAQTPGEGATLQGTVVLPPQAVDLISTPLTAAVQQVLVSPGDRVRTGQPVARLQSTELLQWQREWQQAQAQAQAIATRLARDEQLLAEGLIPELRVIEARTQLRLADLAARERRQMLQALGLPLREGVLQAEFTLNARSAGTVMELNASPGQRLDAGLPVARLARTGQWQLELQASAELAARLRPGARLQVEGCQQPARLRAHLPQVQAGNQSVLLRADLPDREDCVRAGQFVQVKVSPEAGTGTAAGLQVPADAVVQHQGQAHVFVATPQGFVPTPVVLGPGQGTLRPVHQGLKAGDVVVVQGTAALKGAWQGLGGGGS